ncbi:MAG: SelT/SelW/SelH family protein [Lentisphaeraceae bacterium]|nr:SelT/SelW/SelH family protein [Lentisphaeraceae bacterium]
MLRSAWLMQELLSTFEDSLEMVSLKPSKVTGTFNIKVDDQLVWERKRDGGFPEAKILKQRVRDIIDPERSLGHSDS